MSDQDKILLFKTILSEYMLRKSDQLEIDRNFVLNRISLHHLDSESFYDLLVQDIRSDTTRAIFREVMSIVHTYLC